MSHSRLLIVPAALVGLAALLASCSVKEDLVNAETSKLSDAGHRFINEIFILDSEEDVL